MIGDDEIIFSGKYKGFDFNARYGLKNATEKDVTCVLCDIVKKIEPYAYEFSGIDCKKIESIASKAGKNLESIAKFIKENPVRKELAGAVKNELLISEAESYFFNRVLTNANTPMFPDVASSSIKPEKEVVEGQMVFIGKYKGWVAIRKLALDKAEDWEVSGILSGAISTALNKAFSFSGQNENMTTEKRKSFSAAVDLLGELAGKMGSDKTRNAYLVVKSLEALGYPPHANLETLAVAYPSLKPKKPRGRIAKG